jgi:lysophospholipase L1-like esterase
MVVESAANKAGVNWVDASAYLQQQPNKADLYFAQNGHWTAAGHQAIAELLEKVVTESNLLSLETSE